MLTFFTQPITQTVQATATPAPVSPILDLSNPIYQGIGALFGLAAILISLLLWLRDRPRKELSYQVVADTPLISVKEEAELKGRLEIVFDKQPSYNLDLRSVIVRVINSGNVPIGEDDYFGHPLELRFGEKAEVLIAGIVKTEPVDFEAKAFAAGTMVLLQPVLLNKGQSVTIRVLVKEKECFSLYAHLKGVDVKTKLDGIGPFKEDQLRYVAFGWLLASACWLGLIIMSLLLALTGH
jgi:hypothetical protein